MSHTPGPWRCDLAHAGGGLLRYCIQTTTRGIAVVEGRHENALNLEADARLIAAAPEMLAALKLADAVLAAPPQLFAEEGPSRSVVRAAITKAEGQLP